jgi:FG-GAP-like repeat
MKLRLLAVLVLLVLLILADGTPAYVEARYTLPRMIKESTNIVLVKVEKVNKERKLIYYKKIADLKGKHPTEDFKHNIGVGGFNEKEKRHPVEWAEPGKLAIIFHNGGASETCIGKYWYQCYAGGPWWNHSHGEPYLSRTYSGDIEGLKAAVEKLLKGEEVIVPCTVSKTDLRIQKVKASMARAEDYPVVEAPTIEKVPLVNVAGFSEMIDLPRPEGIPRGGIAIDIDADGHTDLLLIGSHGLRLLRNNRKGNFDDITEKWGLGSIQGAHGAAFADYNRSGRPSLLTSNGRLYTNLGDRFRDDTALLPATPKRVTNPGEAFAWVDINNDGLPDILCTLGVRGLAAFQNAGGQAGKWFEDVSEKVGLGPDGLGQEPSNYLTALDLNGDGRTDFVLNLAEPLVALNQKGTFRAVKDTGLSFPALARPALAWGDFRNDGRPGLFVTSARRTGALLDWQMLGTFSADEDKQLAAGPDFSPKNRPSIKLGDDRWNWQPIRARGNGLLEVRRSTPSPNSSYAHTTFEWPRAEKILLYFGSRNGLKAWLNGKPVYDFNGKRDYMADTDRVEVEVRKGPNELLLKVLDEGPLWQTCVRPSPLNLFPPPAVQLYQADDRGTFRDVTAASGDLAQLRADCVSAIWADLDNDNRLDLVVTSKTGLVRVYLNQGNGKFHYATHDLGLEQKFKAEGVLAADFNNDGSLDLVLIGAEGEPCVALLSKLKGKLPPLTVRPGGPESPIGAVVRVTDAAGKLMGTRYIPGGDGRAMQATPEARFALPSGKYRVEVRYSSGKVRAREVTIAGKPLWETIDGK